MKAITIETLQKFITLNKQFSQAEDDLDKARLKQHVNLIDAGVITPSAEAIEAQEKFDQITVEFDNISEDVYSYITHNLRGDHLEKVIDAPGVEETVHAILNPPVG